MKSEQILTSMGKQQRQTIVAFLKNSETFGFNESVQALTVAYYKTPIHEIFVLVNEFWNRNPEKLNLIYARILSDPSD